MDAFEEMYLGAEGALQLKLNQLEEAIATLRKEMDDGSGAFQDGAISNLGFNLFSTHEELAIYERCRAIALQIIRR